MKKAILTSLLSLILCSGYAQQEVDDDRAVYQVAQGFLKWYKAVEYDDTKASKTSEPSYSIIKVVPINKKFKRQLIDKAGVEKYISFYRKSGFLSEEYFNNLRTYFNQINKNLMKQPPIRRNEIIKIDGLDLDIQLQTFEPEIILDNLNNAVVEKSLIIYNKALISVNFSKEVTLIFALTKDNKKWKIDYLAHDNKSTESFFRQ